MESIKNYDANKTAGPVDESNTGQIECRGCGERFDLEDLHKVTARFGNKMHYTMEHFFCDTCWEDLDECDQEVRKYHRNQGPVTVEF